MANIEELRMYQKSLSLANAICDLVLTYQFARKTVGWQIVRSADSISANLAEGYGRYYHKENIHFCYYSRGSLEETKDWLRKARIRKLISEEIYMNLYNQINIIAKQLNQYINSLKSNIK